MDIRSKRAIRASLLALAATAVGLLGSVRSASADTFKFNPTGDGVAADTYSINGLGFGAGNALAVGAVPLAVGETFQVYFQTHLTSLTGPNAPPALPGLNSTYQITEVATLSEVVTNITTTAAGTTATFLLDPTGGAHGNNISIYFNNAVTFNDAAGTGFTNGVKIASLTPTSFTASNFLDQSAGGGAGTLPFNTTGAGNAQLAQSIVGGGSTGINNSVGPYNASFFQPPGGTPLLGSSLFTSNLSAPFTGLSPSLLFNNPITSATFAPNIGPNSPATINGVTGPDLQLAVAGFNQSFTVVPEPASMTLMGLGVIGALVVIRRTRARVA